jgi:hypothetical protein
MDVTSTSPQVTSTQATPASTNEESSAFEAYDRYEAGQSGPTPSDDFLRDETQQAKPETQQAKPEVKAPDPTPAELEYEFVHNGSKVKAPLSKILKWAQQGYDYPQRMAEVNKKYEESSKLAETYKPIDEWVSNNPDKWEKLQRAIELEQQGFGDVDPNNPLTQTVLELKNKLQTIEAEREQIRIKQEDEALDNAVKSIKEKYSDLDWNTVDESGQTREQRVYAHAQKRGISSFEAAFRDLFFDDILQMKEAKAREALVAAKEKEAKEGIVRREKPSNRITRADTNKSYDSLANEALEELRAGKFG